MATHVDAVVQTSDVGRCSWPKKPGDTGSLVLHSSKMFYKEWLSWNPHNGSPNPHYCVNNHLQVSKYNYIINSSIVHYIHCNGKCGPSERLSWSNQEAVTEICWRQIGIHANVPDVQDVWILNPAFRSVSRNWVPILTIGSTSGVLKTCGKW